MTSAALVDLRNRIVTNTLTADQQGALAFALDLIAPVFPNPDELANVANVDELVSREWVAVLYALNADGGVMPPPPGGISDVTGTAPIDVTTPTTGVRNVAIAPATDADAGSMSAADKTKLDALPGSAVAAAVVAVFTASLTDDLAGSTLAAPFVAALRGPAGADGNIPVHGGTSVDFIGVLASPATGRLRFSGDGQGVGNTTDGWIVAGGRFDATPRPVVWRDADHDALVFGNQAWETLYIRADTTIESFLTTTSDGDDTGGRWIFRSDVAGVVATFISDDQTYEWQQGGPEDQKDGTIWRQQFGNTFSTARTHTGEAHATIVLVDNAINQVEIKLTLWDLTATPYQSATYVLKQSYAKQGGVVTEFAGSFVLEGPVELPAGVAAGVNPVLEVDNLSPQTGIRIAITPWTASQLRSFAVSRIVVTSDIGPD
jgi:hypothetical protein